MFSKLPTRIRHIWASSAMEKALMPKTLESVFILSWRATHKRRSSWRMTFAGFKKLWHEKPLNLIWSSYRRLRVAGSQKKKLYAATLSSQLNLSLQWWWSSSNNICRIILLLLLHVSGWQSSSERWVEFTQVSKCEQSASCRHRFSFSITEQNTASRVETPLELTVRSTIS